MADKKVDVGVRLKLEQTDAAASEIDKLRKRVLELEGATKHADTGFLDLAKQAAAMAIGVNIMPAIHQMTEFAKSLVMTSVEGDAADTALAGLITTVQGLPWEQAKHQAGDLGDELDGVSAAAGVMGDDLAAALQVMVEMKGATEAGIAAARHNVEQIATVAGVLGKSVEGIGREFSFMGEGVLRTKGQMFQLLQTTGIFGNDTKKAAEYWSKLTEESRVKLLDYGLSRIATSMAKAEPSAKQLLTSIDSLYETAKERLGDSLLHELVPVLTEVKNRMTAAIPAIEKVAREIGPEVARWVGDAVKKVEDGFKYLKDHSQEIHDAIVSAYDHAKEVVDFILANKDLIALAFGAKAAAPAIGTAVGLGKSLVGGAGAAASAFGIGGAAGTAAGLATFGVAVAAFAAAVYAFVKIMEFRAEKEKQSEGMTDMLQQIREVAQTGNVALVEKLSANMRSTAEVVNGELNPALDATLKSIHSIAETSQEIKEADFRYVQDSIRMAQEKMKDLEQVSRAQFGAGQTQKQVDTYADNVAQVQLDILIHAYEDATKTGNAALASMAATTIASSDRLKDALLEGSRSIEGGMDKFADVVLAGGVQFAGFVGAIRRKEGAKVPGAPVVHMSGGQTFKITQDFRDQDPDRIAVIFQRDIVKLAENRIQARTTIPFGG